MSTNFEKALEKTLEHEGGFVNDVDDSGGATNFGISLRFLKAEGYELDLDNDGDTDAEDMKLLDVDTAGEIYKEYFWDKWGYDSIRHADVAAKMFDMSVNMGARQAHKITQRACNKMGMNLVVDGIAGTQTRNTINSIDNADALLEGLKMEQVAFYNRLVEQKPVLNKFIKGWTRRALA